MSVVAETTLPEGLVPRKASPCGSEEQRGPNGQESKLGNECHYAARLCVFYCGEELVDECGGGESEPAKAKAAVANAQNCEQR